MNPSMTIRSIQSLVAFYVNVFIDNKSVATSFINTVEFMASLSHAPNIPMSSLNVVECSSGCNS